MMGLAMKLAVIGAGVAGLAAAHRLRQMEPATEIVVFEKSRGVGGRAATRRVNGVLFDHGAQYIKGATPPIERLLRDELAHDTLVDIARPVWTFDAANQIAAGDPNQNAEPKWTYTEGLTRLAKELARGLDIRFQARVHQLAYRGAVYHVVDEQGATLATADAVLLTPPAPQTQAIIAASELPAPAQATLVHELAKATYRPCLTLTLGYQQRLRERPFYALVNTDKQHPVSWLAFEHLKPGRATGSQQVLIAQMAPGWSVDHFEDELPALTTHVAELVSTLLNEDLPAPAWSDRQKWRYALPDSGADFDLLNAAQPNLYFAGDYTAGRGRVHQAIEQGWRVAEAINAQTG